MTSQAARHPKTGMKSRLAITVFLLMVIVALVSFGSVYILGASFLTNSIGSDSVEMAGILSTSVSSLINQEVDNIAAHTTNSVHIAAIEASNQRYASEDRDRMVEGFLEIEKEWAGATPESGLIAPYLEGESAQRLKEYLQQDPSIAEAFTTDKFGALVAASGKTTDFYQADEEWWQKAYNGGKGAVYIGDIELDASSGVMALPIALPLRGSDGKVIGVMKAILDVALFLDPLRDFKIGDLGHAVLVDDEGLIIFHDGVVPLSDRLCSKEDFEKLISAPHRWTIVRSSRRHKDDVFLSFSSVRDIHFSKGEGAWRVIVERPLSEIRAPIRRLLLGASFIICLIIVALIPVGYLLGILIVRPISKLREGVLRLGSGDLDYRVQVKTGDELEGLADAFNSMASDLKEKVVTIDDLKRESAAREAAEAKVLKAVKDWSATFDSMVEGVSIHDHNFTVIDVNDTICRILGKTKAELVGRKCFELFHDKHASIAGCPLEHVKTTGKKEQTEVYEPFLKRWLLVSVSPVRDENGAITKFVHVINDVTARKEMENDLSKMNLDLQESEERLKLELVERKAIEERTRRAKEYSDLILKIIPNAVFTVGLKKNITSWNKRAEELTGYAASEMIGKTCALFAELPCKEKCGLFADDVIRPIVHKECTIRRKDGEFRIISKNVDLIKDEFGRTIGGIEIFDDITERKALEQKIAEATEMKSQFVSMVSHELRTPLTAMKEAIGIVLDGSAGPVNEEQKDFLDTAKRNVDRLGRLINDVLDYQRLEAGRTVFYMQKTDIADLIADVINVMLPIAKAKNVRLEASAAPGIPAMIIDKDKMTQVLINLVNNAVKFTDEGSVVLSASIDKGTVLISVKDSGVGIKQEDIPKLFRGFTQLDAGRQKKAGSTGLGLSISKKIVEAHKGTIWVESEYGKGSDFKMTIPVKEQYRVVVVDDEPDLLDMCRRSLEAEGYGVDVSVKGLEALEMIERKRPDIVVMDMRLTDINGYEMIGRLRSNKETSMIPILAMSGYPEELAKLEDKREESALLSIAKPFHTSEFIAMIRSLLRQQV